MLDIAVLKARPDAASTLSVTEAPARVTGIEKLAQRYALLLLCGEGTVKFAETLGGPLVPALLQGAVGSESMLRHLFNITSHAAVEVMRLDDADASLGTFPETEMIDTAVLNSLSIDAAKAVAYIDVTVTSMAGAATVITIPIG